MAYFQKMMQWLGNAPGRGRRGGALAQHAVAMSGMLLVSASCVEDGSRDGSLGVERGGEHSAQLERWVESRFHDFVKQADGSVEIDSCELDVASPNTVGLRFRELGIPQGATIDSARVQFVADARSPQDNAQVEIEALEADDPGGLAPEVILGMPPTSNSLSWQVPSWEEGGRTSRQQTPQLAGLLQRIVDRDGWELGNGIALRLSGTGGRAVRGSCDGHDAPKLTVDYSWTGDPPPQERIRTIMSSAAANNSDGTTGWIGPPMSTLPGDVEVLFLHGRATLPLELDGWTRLAECFEAPDGGGGCMTAADCTQWGDDGVHCLSLPQAEIGTVVFSRVVGWDEPEGTLWTPISDEPMWSMSVLLRGVDTTHPMRDWAGTSNDGFAGGRVPTVYGEPGDLLLSSFAIGASLTDTSLEEAFSLPPELTAVSYGISPHGDGWLASRPLGTLGETVAYETMGSGAASNEDVLISLTIRPAP
ncbi:MAG: hypothetical protein K0V04_11020 [Deltaproteobacteria bacterium]|nr:hypothetical protein [Deltaproteobacteria bacterium]